ncbi:MAG: (d)CMP kinase [Nonlabens sp.]
MKKITIAIDGHSSTGKSTAAKRLAAYLKYIYVDTGAMYRAIAFYVIKQDLHRDGAIDEPALINQLANLDITFKLNETTGNADVYLNGENIEKEIRTLEVSNLVSRVAEVSEVRSKLVQQQQEMGRNGGVVMDGRDIGSVVFPEAQLKVFMTASPDVRARRRYDELVERGDDVNYEEVYHNVLERDRIDSSRADSPLIQLPEARLLDTSLLSREEQFEKLIQWVESL